MSRLRHSNKWNSTTQNLGEDMSFTTEEDREATSENTEVPAEETHTAWGEESQDATVATEEQPEEVQATQEEAPATDVAQEDAVTREDEGHRLGWSGNKRPAGTPISTTTVRDGGEGLFEHHV